MRDMMKVTAALMVAGAVGTAAIPAFAGPDEAHQDSFWSNQAVPSQGTAGSGYMQMDPRDAKANPNAAANVDQADASNAYFNHAEGTMTGPTAAAPQAPAAPDNGRYVATYQQQYMQVDPRDQKVVKGGDQDDNIYYYHSMGTMAHP